MGPKGFPASRSQGDRQQGGCTCLLSHLAGMLSRFLFLRTSRCARGSRGKMPQAGFGFPLPFCVRGLPAPRKKATDIPPGVRLWLFSVLHSIFFHPKRRPCSFVNTSFHKGCIYSIHIFNF